jgi:UDP-N-acetylglucosamine 2-epimerase (non-hydrolysing)
MKIAPIVEELKKAPDIRHVLVHSGQHHDELLSGNFFSDLGLPTPDANLQVGSGSHAVQTAEIMKRIEPVLLEEKPDMVLVVGDVNSTLAAAVTAAKLGLKIAHIEAGLRSFDMTMPEEINRKLTDAISTLLFATEKSAVENLRSEGVPAEKIFLVGNVMIDCLLRHREIASRSSILEKLGLRKDSTSNSQRYAVLTLHRPSNVDDPKVFKQILDAVNSVAADLPVFFPIHPRTRKKIESFGLGEYLTNDQNRSDRGIIALDPLGYLDFLSLTDHATLILTDSGGVQEETTVLGVPCLTLRENTERPATVEEGSNQIVGVNPDRIREAAASILSHPKRSTRRPPLWDGKAAERIVAVIRDSLNHSNNS